MGVEQTPSMEGNQESSFTMERNHEQTLAETGEFQPFRRIFIRELREKTSAGVFKFIAKWAVQYEKEAPFFIQEEALQSLPEGAVKMGCIVGLHRLNNLRFINKHLEKINGKLASGGYFIGVVETAAHHKMRMLKKYPKPLNYAIYAGDYLINRVWPKLPRLRKVYFSITKGQNRVLSKIETLGRLYSCGFKLIDSKTIDGLLYFVAEKNGQPAYNTQATYSPIIKLNRTGKGGKMIKVYKLRTMHPYSEYLQPYIYETQGLQEGGKFKDDPRVHWFGRFSRKFWLDELPMLWNIVRGDLKIVGVRPLSKHYQSLYPEDFIRYRSQFKPGFIPPFYVDMPNTLEEIIDSEKRYLQAYEKAGYKTDITYFQKAIFNILIKRARSK